MKENKMQSLNYQMHGIFPVPIYCAKLKKFTDIELKVVRSLQNKSSKNLGNYRSKDSYILKLKHFKNIKKQLDQHILNYFDKVVCTSNKVVPYITQSWLNYTRENEYHHSHRHQNSFISGVLYFDADRDNDKIYFEKAKYEQISLKTNNFNLYNSPSWFFQVESRDLIIFPSDTQHFVQNKKGSNVRTSLSFNVFIKGEVGDKEALTELII